jgi:hypothetical protein
MATPHRLRHHAGSLGLEWHALKDRLLSDVGRTVRIASMTLTARRMCR